MLMYLMHCKKNKKMMIKLKSIFLFVITKGYKLYNPQTKKVIVNRDAIFYEQVVWDWSSNKKGPSSVHIHLEEQSEDQSMNPTITPIMTLCLIESSRCP